MSVVGIEDTNFKSRTRYLWSEHRYIAKVFDGADDTLDALEAMHGALNRNGKLISTAFQTLNWLTVLYEELASAKGAVPRVVVVTDSGSGDIAFALPLVVYKKRKLRIASFADLGVAAYGAPILGPATPLKPRAMQRAWREVRRAIRDVDLILLENMPLYLEGIPNPLAARAGLTPSRHVGSTVELRGGEYLLDIDRIYLDVERCRSPWPREWPREYPREDAPRFARASRPEEIARAFSVLEEQEKDQLGLEANWKPLHKCEDRPFFERLVMDGSEVDLSHLFTLEANGEIIATLLAIGHEGTATFLRMSRAGEEWNFLCPERLIVVEALRYFAERGVRHIDLGRSEEALKLGLPARTVPLMDLIVARGLAAVPRATYYRARGRMEKSPRLRTLASRLSVSLAL